VNQLRFDHRGRRLQMTDGSGFFLQAILGARNELLIAHLGRAI
jgi:hypothetical protein